MSDKIKKSFRSVSVLSLDMYLVSYMFDVLYYSFFAEHVFCGQTRFALTFITVVPAVLLSSYAVAWVKNQVFTRK